jgi:hypothetical protein
MREGNVRYRTLQNSFLSGCFDLSSFSAPKHLSICEALARRYATQRQNYAAVPEVGRERWGPLLSFSVNELRRRRVPRGFLQVFTSILSNRGQDLQFPKLTVWSLL